MSPSLSTLPFKSLTATLAATLLFAAVPIQAQATPSVADRTKALHALFEDIWQQNLKHSPEFASSIGDKRYNDQLSDYSIEEVNASLARGRKFIQQLSEIDTTGLAQQDQVSDDLMLRSLIDDQEAAKFKEWEMPVNQFNGPHTALAQLVAQLSFETVKDYEDYIARLTKIPTVFSQITTNMQLGMEDGRMPPKYLLEKVLVQTNALATQKPADSPFALPLKKFPKTISPDDQKRLSDAVLDAVANDVLPAYQRFARFLSGQYIAKGRTEPGISAIPDGDAYYAFRVRQSTTLNKTPAEIHQIGLDEVKRDETEMLAIAKKLGFSDLKSFNAALKTNPKEHPTSKQQLLDAYRNYIAGMKPKLPELFGRLPKAPIEVVPVPDYIEKDQAAAYYDNGTPDGSRPGRVFINTYNFANRSLADVEAVAYHEGIPGHHLQISIAQELTDIPEFRKYTYYTAYTEGWALYSERLGKEIGFYQDPYSDYGRLEADIWRAIRLVVDTGVHSQHWTRQQMVDYFHDHSAIDETNIQAETDRYIAWPGQALGYKMGQLKILELRQRAQTALGPKFQLKDFHDVVIDSGALPLDVLEKQVDAWIAKEKAS
ncbi:DUF885 domain-containing protein [Granulicella arctica]|uniref:Uncharacterized protein (DUF885 family) n=1 Tax=Granulicella arctica TaxID=940613 RepID=A0A7Y9PHG3_9BACT|nr:DUF885 domain-containing protein [Granulicella arctica]NYF79958.1 uncharacterized protein (DUF885 family) [Granulicella arctica]